MPYKIGIICITTEGSTVCEKEISRLGGLEGQYPRYAVEAIPVYIYSPSLFARNWQALSELIIEAINNLPKNVDFIIMPSNTPHYAYDLIRTQSSKPVLNLIDITADACQQAGYKRVAILGTKLTMTAGLYQEKIVSRGMELVVPSLKICDALESLIRYVLIPGLSIAPGTPNGEKFQFVMKSIKENIMCDAFILGCTELTPCAEYLSPTIDTTLLLARVAFKIAMEEDKALLMKYSIRTNRRQNAIYS